MSRKKSVVIGIPAYKVNLTASETASLRQLVTVLGDYEICLFTHNELDISSYKHIIADHNLNVVYFDKKYFTGTYNYTRLLCSYHFYKSFNNYEHILIYQLDAWVFSDSLTEWCNAGYDYIGAPWFDGFDKATPDSPFLGVGNGGFSLRNIKSSIKILTSFCYIIPFSSVIKDFRNTKLSLASIKQLLFNLTINNNTFSLFNNYNGYEDIFWGMVVPLRFKQFKIPGMIEASKFSTEVNAEMLYNLNSALPFGCHAWEKYDVVFWNRFIKINENLL